ncbi:MAG: hypothetical protein AAB407_03015 [Patescibacteria group bacterium]
MKKKRNVFKYFADNLVIVIALVLIWRDIWLMLDGFDRMFFGGNHYFSSLGGIILGFALLYLPDKDLKEIQKL